MPTNAKPHSLAATFKSFDLGVLVNEELKKNKKQCMTNLNDLFIEDNFEKFQIDNIKIFELRKKTPNLTLKWSVNSPSLTPISYDKIKEISLCKVQFTMNILTKDNDLIGEIDYNQSYNMTKELLTTDPKIWALHFFKWCFNKFQKSFSEKIDTTILKGERIPKDESLLQFASEEIIANYSIKFN